MTTPAEIYQRTLQTEKARRERTRAKDMNEIKHNADFIYKICCEHANRKAHVFVYMSSYSTIAIDSYAYDRESPFKFEMCFTERFNELVKALNAYDGIFAKVSGNYVYVGWSEEDLKSKASQ